MRYRLLILFFSLTLLSGQSLFNRFVGTDLFMGSARATAMGNTHLLNSTGSTNIRFNPANLVQKQSRLGFDFQVNRSSVFERWSMPVRDSFGEFLTHADYVANEFIFYGASLGLFGSTKIPGIGIAGMGFHYGPLTHFNYQYSEEVRGSYRIEDGEYASKDPIVGYQNLQTDGSPIMTSLGGGIQLAFLGDIDLCIGGAINLIQSTKSTDKVSIDTLYSDVINLSTLLDMNASTDMPSSNFMALSTTMKLFSWVNIGLSWEDKMESSTSIYSLQIDSTNGLFQYFDDGSYVINGIDYMKPEIKSLAVSLISDLENMMSIDFELDQVSYNSHLNLKDYKQYKFGFEYLTQMGTPIRGGLVYRQASILAMKPVSMFTFGSGKSIGNLKIDYAGTYSFQSFNYPDLFPVEGDIRSEYDLVRDSQLHLQLAATYKF